MTPQPSKSFEYSLRGCNHIQLNRNCATQPTNNHNTSIQMFDGAKRARLGAGGGWVGVIAIDMVDRRVGCP